MKYVAYKLFFQTGVHFGSGMLDETRQCFLADTLFSALCVEAVKMGNQTLEKLYQLVKNGEILFSDSFPFIDDTLYIPKPMLSIKCEDSDISSRKKWKNLKYIPLQELQNYLLGKMDVEKESHRLEELGTTIVQQKVSLMDEEKSEPYSVGVFYFQEGNGLYFIVGYEKEENLTFLEQLIDSLGFQGIGGKVSSGLGKYSMLPIELPTDITRRMERTKGKFMVLTTSLPKEDEMERAISQANYLLEKRSGFIQSETYAKEQVKKQVQYFLQSGSIVYNRYSGDVYEVGRKGTHSVWRYGKPLLMGVSE